MDEYSHKLYRDPSQIGRDAFDLLHEWAGYVTETAYVCGSGPSITGVLDRIPRDSFSIALNGAITLDYQFSAWTVFDEHAKFWGWYHTDIPRKTLVLFGNSVVDERADYYYQVDSTATTSVYPDRVCGRCTVAGCAIALVHAAQKHNGYINPRIILAGVDMHGSEHASGEIGVQTEVWQQRDELLRLIRSVQSTGTVVQSLTETQLHLEIV